MAQVPSGFRFLSHDELTGITTSIRHNYDASSPSKSTTEIAYTSDAEGLIDQNKREQYDARGTFCQRGREGVKAASIPPGLLMKWQEEEGLDLSRQNEPEQQKLMARLLNSSDYQAVRVAQFRL